jgi:tetratricopeptide (TPR) repeat protein
VYFPRRSADFRPVEERAAAEIRAQTALAKNPEDIEALAELAVASYEKGPDHALKALEYLEKARELGSLDDRLDFYAGALYESQGVVENYAVREYERFLRRHPEDADVLLRLGRLYYFFNEAEKAAGVYQRALAPRPGDPLVSFNLALAWRSQKKYAEGLALLDPLISPRYRLPSGGWKLHGDLLRLSGRPVSALEDYGRELALSGETAELAGAMALAHEDMETWDDALSWWEKVLSLDPGNRDAKNALRRIKRRR